MATSQSGLSEPRVPKPSNQGSSTSAHTQKPSMQGGKPGGFHQPPPDMDQPKRRGIYPSGIGGTGSGANKGDHLPR